MGCVDNRLSPIQESCGLHEKKAKITRPKASITNVGCPRLGAPSTHLLCVALSAGGPVFCSPRGIITGAALATFRIIKKVTASTGESAICTFRVGPFAVLNFGLFAVRVQSPTPLQSAPKSVHEAKGLGLWLAPVLDNQLKSSVDHRLVVLRVSGCDRPAAVDCTCSYQWVVCSNR